MPKPVTEMGRAVACKVAPKPDPSPHGPAEREAAAILRSRRFCCSCGMLLAQANSKQKALCARCSNHCPRCGARTQKTGHHGVCLRCVPQLLKEIEDARKGRWKPPAIPKSYTVEELPTCTYCGDEAASRFDGKWVCPECHGDKLGQKRGEENR